MPLATFMFAAALALTASILGAVPSQADPAKSERMPRAVVELFTSQGCAACPPADALLGRIARQPGVIGLTMPTRLWDYLGWADTLATDDLTKRQMAYSVALDTDVFTPQVVVNGDIAVVGSDRAAVDAAVRQTERFMSLPIALSVDDGVLSISVDAADETTRDAVLWLALVVREVTVPVRRGENRGRDLRYYNVVTDLRPIGMWKGSPVSIDLPLAGVEARPGAGCVVFAQTQTFKGPGKIVGAAQLRSLVARQP